VKSKFNKAFTLVEVIITVGILSTAIVFVLRSFMAALSATQLSQNITLASFLAEDKLWEIEQKQKHSASPLGAEQGIEKIEERDFNWKYATTKLEESDLIELKFAVSFPEKRKENKYALEFLTYLMPKRE